MDPSPPVSCALSSFTVVTEEQLSSLVCSAKIKSCALDPVPTHVLKECLSVLLPALMKIVNLSIESALAPDCFKLALLNPLLEKPRLDFEIYANFRPISNLPVIFISKLTEKVVASQLVDYEMQNDLDETFQSAYKQLHSTETALVRVNNDILVALDNHQSVILLLLDLSAAFNTVDHGILLDRLSHRFGICGLALSWFKSYLSNRFQFVEIRGEKSSHQPLTCGVPQGSALGPILYLLYTSPLGDILRRYNMGFHFYADDTQLCLSFDSLSGEGQASAVHSIEACASEIDEWMRLNKLKLNSDKSELLVITGAQPKAGTGHKMQSISVVFSTLHCEGYIADFRYRWLITPGSACWLTEILSAILKSMRHGSLLRSRSGRSHVTLLVPTRLLQTDIHSFLGNEPINVWLSFSCECSRL